LLMSHTFIEVCSGAGGLSQGFIQAGFQPILLNDNDKDCCETLRKNHIHHNDIIVQKDMCQLKLTEYHPTILIGGIPCQSFSQAGKRKGLEDKRGNLVFEFARLIDECSPTIFMIENVKGLVTLEKGKVFDEIKQLLSRDGRYAIHHKVLNALHFGVPQKRERVFIVGSLCKKEFAFPEPEPTKLILRDVLLDIPSNNDGSCEYSSKKKEVMKLVPAGGCWVDLPEPIKTEYMGKAMQSGGGKRGMARRLSLDEPSLTLTTSPNQKQTERCHPIETRPFTVREYARIQTFTDTYTFAGSISSRYRQIGNAVPVKLATAMAKAILQVLESS
jgi:DNA (cytosine-5)-methyltransferase 1